MAPPVLVTILLAVAGLALAAVAVSGLRHPILLRMAGRNAWRRPKQTFTVVAGLMIGTAIISSSLVAGDSARDAIRGYVYQSLGHVDESVAIPGYAFFPQSVATRLASDQAVSDVVDGQSPILVWQGAAKHGASGTFEPAVAVVGYDGAADAAFGDFHLVGGGVTDGRGLAQGETILTEKLARVLDADAGDTVTLSYVDPFDPLLPSFTLVNVTLSGTPLGVPGLPVGGLQAGEHVAPFTVNATSTRITAVLGGAPLAPVVDLDAAILDPAGAVAAQASGTRIFLNVTTAPDEVLAAGEWSLRIRASAPIPTQVQGAIVVLRPVYDLVELQERAERLGEGSDDLQELGAQALDFLADFQAPKERDFRVVAVTDGGRGDMFDLGSVFFVRLDEAQAMFDREGQVNVLKISNPGNEREGVAGTDRAFPAINATLSRIKQASPDVAAIQALETRALKQDLLKEADSKGQTLTGLLVFAGSLSITTGLLLILNIFTMLAEERRSELGMARAIGLTRNDLVRAFLYEGAVYALGAAIVGAILGLAMAFGMIQLMNTIIARVASDLAFPPIAFRPSLSALAAAVGTGATLTLATVYFAARRQSNLNVVRAIRRIEEPEKIARRAASIAFGTPMAIAGLGVSVLAWWAKLANLFGSDADPLAGTVVADFSFTLRVLGPLVLAVGVAVFLRPFVPRQKLVPWVAAALGAYYVLSYFLIARYENRAEVNVVGPLRGVLLTVCLVVLVVHWPALPRAVGRLLGRLKFLRAAALPAVSYPLHRRFRTGMTLAMFSVVLLSIGFFSIFGALFQTDPVRQTGGFDIEARTTLSVPDLAEYDRGEVPSGLLASQIRLPELRTEDRGFLTVNGERVGTFRDYRHTVYGFGSDFAAAQEFRLMERLDGYPSDRAAYDAVLASDNLVIVSYIYSTNPEGQSLSHHVGENLTMHLGDTAINYTIVGIQEQYHFPGVFLPVTTVETLFPQTADVYLYKLAPGSDSEAAARILESNYRDVGMDAKATVPEVLEEQASFRQVLSAMKLFLGLSLLVGVLSLGIITSRSVLERRQEIGMLRALGFTGKEIRRIFFTEVTFTILLGSVVGIACALIVTFGLWFAVIRQLSYPYIVPWSEIGILVAVSYIVAMLAAWVPIGRSAKVAPAEALRYLE